MGFDGSLEACRRGVEQLLGQVPLGAPGARQEEDMAALLAKAPAEEQQRRQTDPPSHE